MFSSSFFDAELVGGAYDRVYAASNFAEYFASFIANGVFPDPATNLQVVANTTTNMTVLASAGLGWINGYYCKNSNPYPIAIAAASGSQARIDSIMLRWDKAARNITAYVKMGTPSANPQPPTVERTPDVYELMLATVLVGAGVTKITQANITDKRADKAVCGWVSGVVDQIDATNLFAQYDAAFKTWFKDIQDQLSGDVATNLQNQINALKTDKLAVASKATKAEAEAGTDDTKWMTPLSVGQKLSTYPPIGDIVSSYRDLERLTAGNFLACDGRSVTKEAYPGLFPSILRVGHLSTKSLSSNRSYGSASREVGGAINQSRTEFCVLRYYNDSTAYVQFWGAYDWDLTLGGGALLRVFTVGELFYVLSSNYSQAVLHRLDPKNKTDSIVGSWNISGMVQKSSLIRKGAITYIAVSWNNLIQIITLTAEGACSIQATSYPGGSTFFFLGNYLYVGTVLPVVWYRAELGSWVFSQYSNPRFPVTGLNYYSRNGEDYGSWVYLSRGDDSGEDRGYFIEANGRVTKISAQSSGYRVYVSTTQSWVVEREGLYVAFFASTNSNGDWGGVQWFTPDGTDQTLPVYYGDIDGVSTRYLGIFGGDGEIAYRKSVTYGLIQQVRIDRSNLPEMPKANFRTDTSAGIPAFYVKAK